MAAPMLAPDAPTTRVVWEVVDQDTVRVRWEDTAAPPSDGVPTPIEAERSATVAVVMVDLEDALTSVLAMAAHATIPVELIRLRTEELGRPAALALCIADWLRFHRWFPDAIRRLTPWYVRQYGSRKGSAIALRLGLLAAEIAARQPPVNHLVVRLES